MKKEECYRWWVRVAKDGTQLGASHTVVPVNSLYCKVWKGDWRQTIYCDSIFELFFTETTVPVYVECADGVFRRRLYTVNSGVGKILQEWLYDNIAYEDIINWKIEPNLHKTRKSITPQLRKVNYNYQRSDVSDNAIRRDYFGAKYRVSPPVVDYIRYYAD